MQMTQKPCRPFAGLPPTEEQQESTATPAFGGNGSNMVFREPRYKKDEEVATSGTQSP